MDGTNHDPKEGLVIRLDCPDAMQMAQYLDGNVTRQEANKMDNHFAKCTECRRSLIELRAIMSAEGEFPLDPGEMRAVVSKAASIVGHAGPKDREDADTSLIA